MKPVSVYNQEHLLVEIVKEAQQLSVLEEGAEPLRWSLARHVAEARAVGIPVKLLAQRSKLGPARLAAYGQAWKFYGELPARQRPKMADALVTAGMSPEVQAAMTALAEARGVNLSTLHKSRADRQMIRDVRELLLDRTVAEAVIADPQVAREVAQAVVRDHTADAAISMARGQRDSATSRPKAGLSRQRQEHDSWLVTLGRLSEARRALRKAMDSVAPSELDPDSRADLVQWADDVLSAATAFKTYVEEGDVGSIDSALSFLLGGESQ